ncbi:MAG: FtsB family cell division protein [Haloechinothrix sp.]
MTEAARALGLSTTRRAAVAAIVVCALAFTLAVPLRTYLAQQTAVAEQEELKAELQDRVRELERRKAELADPAQVEAEARRRLRYVMPGETPYIVQLPEDSVDADESADAEHERGTGAWYERLWSNVAG